MSTLLFTWFSFAYYTFGGGGGQEKFYAETLHTEAQPFPLLAIPNFWQKE